MIYAPVRVSRIRDVVSMNLAAQSEDSRARCEYGIPLRGFLNVLRTPEIRRDDIAQGFRQQRIARTQQTIPVAVHPQIKRIVVEQLRRPFGGMNLGDLG